MKLFGKADEPQPSLEELEIEKIVRREENNDSGLSFDAVYDDAQDRLIQVEKSEEQKTETAEDAAPSSASSTEPGERVTGDSEDPGTSDPGSTDDMSEDDEENETEMSDEERLIAHTEEEELPEEPAVSTEHLRQIMSRESSQVLKYNTPTFESYDGYPESYNWAEGSSPTSTSSVGSATWTFAKNAVKWLGNLGIKLTTDSLPNLAKHTYKGLIYAFDRLGYSFMVGFTTLDRYLNRRMNSFSNLHANIEQAQKTLELLSGKRAVELTERDVFDNTAVIRQISIGDSKDIVRHIPVLTKFLHDVINSFGVSIKEDLIAIKELIEHSKVSSSDLVLELLKANFKMDGLHVATIPGFENDNPLLVNYAVGTVLPGNVNLIAHLPNNEQKTREEWIEAYRNSEVFLGVNRTKFKLIESIPYNDVDYLKKIVAELKKLVELCIKHQTFYEDMRKQKLGQRLAYKNYFDGLIKNPEKISVKNSLVDLVTIKNNFIDKVYLPAAIDIHDYTVRVINAYLKYIEKNIKVLTP